MRQHSVFPVILSKEWGEIVFRNPAYARRSVQMVHSLPFCNANANSGKSDVKNKQLL